MEMLYWPPARTLTHPSSQLSHFRFPGSTTLTSRRLTSLCLSICPRRRNKDANEGNVWSRVEDECKGLISVGLVQRKPGQNKQWFQKGQKEVTLQKHAYQFNTGKGIQNKRLKWGHRELIGHNYILAHIGGTLLILTRRSGTKTQV